MEKTCIIGANGFLGRKCLDSFAPVSTVVAADIANTCIPKNVPFQPIDITKLKSVRKILTREHPDLVLLTAAMTDVDGCEDFPEKAFAINRDGPKYVSQICKEIEARLIHISTDFVFDGEKTTPYVEMDDPRPISQYGVSKLQGEQEIRDSGCQAIICRTSVLYGIPYPTQRDNFVTWLLKRLEMGEPTQIVTTQRNTPTFGDNLAECLAQMKEFSGFEIFHTVGGSCLNRYDFAGQIVDIFGFSADLIEPIESFTQKASRPANGCLSNIKASEAFSVHFATTEESLKVMRSLWVTGNKVI